MTDPTIDPVAFLREIQLNYMNQLAVESAAPHLTYGNDGQTVSWDEHRASLIQTIQNLNLVIQMFDPREFQTNVI